MDYLVIGAGPAGLQLGWFLRQAGRDHLILEAGPTPGTFFRTFPRHRRMTSISMPHPGRPDAEPNLRTDWNSLLSDDPNLLFTRYTDECFPNADEYVRYLTDYAAVNGLNVRYDTKVMRIARDGSRQFVVTDQHGHVYRARRLIVATGLSRPYVPPIPGIETTERYSDVSVDPAGFAGRRVLIIGSGDAALETADNLVESAAVVHVLDGAVRRIERAGREFLVTLSHARRHEVVQLRYDRVIACTGFQMDWSIFDDSCRPARAVNGRFPALTTGWESVNVPDLYFAGTLAQVRDLTKTAGAFVHGFRYDARALQRMLDCKYEGAEWPHRELPADAETLTEAVLARINRSSALVHQYAFLCDLIVVDPGGAIARYYEELPVDYVHDSLLGSAECYFVITLEYGDGDGDGHDASDSYALEAGRAWAADPSRDDRYLQPVVRSYRRWSLISVQRLPEDMCDDWSTEEEYGEPLRAYFATQMAFAPV
jgi:thioredoxin reductase